jgi:hypothetical protein
MVNNVYSNVELSYIIYLLYLIIILYLDGLVFSFMGICEVSNHIDILRLPNGFFNLNDTESFDLLEELIKLFIRVFIVFFIILCLFIILFRFFICFRFIIFIIFARTVIICCLNLFYKVFCNKS